MAHRPKKDLDAIAEIDPRIGIGQGVVEVKVNHIETPDEVAHCSEEPGRRLGTGRIRYVHPDCRFWMLKRSIADHKMAALVRVRDRYLGT